VDIFQNHDVLTIPYVPEKREDIIARDEQCEQVIRHLSVIERGRNPDNVMIYGRSGTGKSLLTKFFTKKLVEEKGHIRVYVNCEKYNTTYRVLKKVADTIGGRQILPISGLPLSECYDRLWELLRSTKKYAVVILDEVDKLKDTNILYCIPRAVENEDLDRMNVSIIGITNRLDFKEENLDPRILSTLGRKEMTFPNYNANQLREILSNRAKSAFFDGALDSSIIPLCAALSMSSGYGDAREAIDLLRVAGEAAEREQSMVREEHVREAQSTVERDRVAEVIETLPTSLKLVLYAITHLSESDSEINTGKVYDCYQRLCRQISIDSISRVRVAHIISELDLLGIINAKVRYMGRYGRTREIILGVPRTQTQELLLEDTMLQPLRGLKLMRGQTNFKVQI